MTCGRTALGVSICLAIAIVAIACNRKSHVASTPSASPSPTISEPASDKSQPPSAIRQIDFENFTYPKLPTGKCSMNNVRLVDGRYDAPANIAGTHPAIDCWSVSTGDIKYGDVTGDGEEEAIVELYAELGGTEAASDIFI